jgi:hypothetical protein
LQRRRALCRILPSSIRAKAQFFHFRQYAVAEGMVSYGVSLAGECRQFGIYVGKALKDDKLADCRCTKPLNCEVRHLFLRRASSANHGQHQTERLDTPPTNHPQERKSHRV